MGEKIGCWRGVGLREGRGLRLVASVQEVYLGKVTGVEDLGRL